MGDFDRRDRLLPRLDAVDELGHVVVGSHELEVHFRFGRLHLLLPAAVGFPPFFVGRFKTAAIDRNPAVFADPLRAALDIAVAAGDDHFDVVGILALDAILARRVPDGVLRAGTRPWPRLPRGPI